MALEKLKELLYISCILLSIVLQVSALYSAGSGVIDLTPSNFHQEVVNSDEVWVVEFYAPWCGHCKSLVPEYQKAAKALKGVVKVGAVNADEHKGLGGQYGVQGFPTIKIFGANKYKPDDFQGQRSAQAIVDGALKAAKDLINSRLSGKSSGGGSSGNGGSSDDVIELTDSNFEKKVLDSDDMWLVEFFAPWCGHCKNLAPHWAEAATKLKGKVKLGALDATVNTVKASQYDVKGYPTIKFFYKGEVEDYDGGRTASDIVSWATDKAAANIPPPELIQLTSNKVLEEACKEHPLCIIAVLPDILDCQSKCRNDYLEMLLKLGDKYKQKLWGWVWTEALQHPELERTLDIGGVGYPTLALVNVRKMQFAPLRGSFSYDGLNELLRDISFGRGRTEPVRGAQLPTIKTVEAWDGKDGVLPEEDEWDLSDVDLDPLDKEEL